jgi:Clp amino terminal domain, pathogenicity island component
MAEFPVSLDHLITYVKTLHPGGGPLDELSGAMTVSEQLDEQSDALIGYFVDQARRSGESWSQIGTSMGVSKQAAQKRFVPRSLVPEGQQMFSRFTPRALNVLAAARQLAAPDPVGVPHLAAGLLTEPDGLAARVVKGAGLTSEQFCTAAGAGPAEPADSTDPAALQDIHFADGTAGALKGTLKVALGLGHNYIGTEHILLGILAGDSASAQALAAAGLDSETAGRLLKAEFDRIQAARKAAG